jgi:hypothetical protein
LLDIFIFFFLKELSTSEMLILLDCSFSLIKLFATIGVFGVQTYAIDFDFTSALAASLVFWHRPLLPGLSVETIELFKMIYDI